MCMYFNRDSWKHKPFPRVKFLFVRYFISCSKLDYLMVHIFYVQTLRTLKIQYVLVCEVEEISIYIDISSREITNKLNECANCMQTHLTTFSQKRDASKPTKCTVFFVPLIAKLGSCVGQSWPKYPL